MESEARKLAKAAHEAYASALRTNGSKSVTILRWEDLPAATVNAWEQAAQAAVNAHAAMRAPPPAPPAGPNLVG